eukprot:PhM_4_TR2031/c1_g1_i1/m.39497
MSMSPIPQTEQINVSVPFGLSASSSASSLNGTTTTDTTTNNYGNTRKSVINVPMPPNSPPRVGSSGNLPRCLTPHLKSALRESSSVERERRNVHLQHQLEQTVIDIVRDLNDANRTILDLEEEVQRKSSTIALLEGRLARAHAAAEGVTVTPDEKDDYLSVVGEQLSAMRSNLHQSERRNLDLSRQLDEANAEITMLHSKLWRQSNNNNEGSQDHAGDMAPHDSNESTQKKHHNRTGQFGKASAHSALQHLVGRIPHNAASEPRARS